MSESDLNNTTPPNFRHKRGREELDDSITKSQLRDFKDEITTLIKSLLLKQENELRLISPALKEIQNTNKNIENSIEFLAAQNDELQKKIDVLEGQRQEDRKYIAILEDKIEELQKGSRKANIELKNVPKADLENKEDMIGMVVSLSESIGCKIEKNDIKDIYRVRGRKDGKPNTPIIIETSSTLLKTEILSKCKIFNKSHSEKLCAKHLGLKSSGESAIFVSEQLTAKGARLHFLARDLAKTRAYKYCWTAYGKIYVRKDDNSPVIQINSEAQVQHLFQKP